MLPLCCLRGRALLPAQPGYPAEPADPYRGGLGAQLLDQELGLKLAEVGEGLAEVVLLGAIPGFLIGLEPSTNL